MTLRELISQAMNEEIIDSNSISNYILDYDLILCQEKIHNSYELVDVELFSSDEEIHLKVREL